MIALPGATGSGESDIATPRSAAAVTEVVAVSESLFDVGSPAVVLTVAVSDSMDPSGAPDETSTERVNVAESPTARFGDVQEIDPPAPGEGASRELNVVPAGSASASVTSASFGPLFVTVIVYSSPWPAVTGSGESDTVTAMSAGAAGCTKAALLPAKAQARSKVNTIQRVTPMSAR